jgi:hypothetical protein
MWAKGGCVASARLLYSHFSEMHRGPLASWAGGGDLCSAIRTPAHAPFARQAWGWLPVDKARDVLNKWNYPPASVSVCVWFLASSRRVPGGVSRWFESKLSLSTW